MFDAVPQSPDTNTLLIEIQRLEEDLLYLRLSHVDAAVLMVRLANHYYTLSGRIDDKSLTKAWYWITQAVKIIPDSSQALDLALRIYNDHIENLRYQLEECESAIPWMEVWHTAIEVVSTGRSLTFVTADSNYCSFYSTRARHFSIIVNNALESQRDMSYTNLIDNLEEISFCINAVTDHLSRVDAATRVFHEEFITQDIDFIRDAAKEITQALVKSVPKTEQALQDKEQCLLRIINLLSSINAKEDMANIYAILASLYKDYLINNRVLKTRARLEKMYQYAKCAIDLKKPALFSHLSLDVVSIYGMYAQSISKNNPTVAREICLRALEYNDESDSNDSVSLFYCLQELAGCSLNMINLNEELIDDEYNRRFETNIQMGINYCLRALDYLRHHHLRNVSPDNCYHLLSTFYYCLSLHYVRLVKEGRYHFNQMIADNTHQSIEWAIQEQSPRKIAKAYNLLANFYYYQKRYTEAIDYWQIALKNNLTAIQEEAKGLDEFADRVHALFQTKSDQEEEMTVSEVKQFYNNLTTQIIALGHEIKTAVTACSTNHSTSGNDRNKRQVSEFFKPDQKRRTWRTTSLEMAGSSSDDTSSPPSTNRQNLR